MENNLQDFIERLKDPDWLEKVGPNLALLDIGNVAGLIQYARTLGFDFTQQDVATFLASMATPDHGLATTNLEMKDTSPGAPPPSTGTPLMGSAQPTPDPLLNRWIKKVQ